MQSDKDTKLLISNMLKNVMAEIGQLKEGQEVTIQKILKEVKDASQDSAERAHFLSRYIDEEIIKVGGKTSKQVDNLKVLCAKLTEQFKKHLINHESMKKDLYKRFEIIESHLPVYRSELFKQMETTEARMLNKLKELKDALSQTILTNFTALDDRVDQFSELVSSDYYFYFLGGQQFRNPASGVAGQSRGVRKHHQQDQRRRRAQEQQSGGRPRKNYRRGLLSPCQSRIGREEAS